MTDRSRSRGKTVRRLSTNHVRNALILLLGCLSLGFLFRYQGDDAAFPVRVLLHGDRERDDGRCRVVANIPANAAQNAAGIGNSASTITSDFQSQRSFESMTSTEATTRVPDYDIGIDTMDW